MPKVVAIIQARMGSTRLPGKVMMPMAGKPMLQRVIERVQHANVADKIIVASPFGETCEEPIERLCKELGVGFFQCGNEDDVLHRFSQCARLHDADVVVRVCGDSPMLRTDLISECVDRLILSETKYTHYTFTDGTPCIETKRGCYPEACTSDWMILLDSVLNRDDPGREHVTQPMRNVTSAFMVEIEDDGINRSVDTQEDFDRVEQMILEEEATTNANDHISEREAVGAG
jgi:spore coat polysaccharide biosynthesis protein SpsF